MDSRLKHIFQLVSAVAVGIAAHRWVNLSVWEGMANGLFAFLGLLVAALVQVIPITAGFTQPDFVSPAEAKKLGTALEIQQKLWLALLGIAFVSVLVLVLGVAVAPHDKEVLAADSLRSLSAPWLSGAIAFMVWYVAIRALSLIPGVLSLQRIRSRLNIEAAKHHERVRPQAFDNQNIIASARPIVPDGYGKMITPKKDEDASHSADT
ncbi:hypothetical protein [Desulfocurvus vexinensis]|uniref:hypothetical protein n=1 Tax=Desulfocurvus vexinensis TaxID=399548 RepID=UPI0012EBCBE6|nr:hypothetical protein [Desulfocurvus vexinensis]